MAKFADQFVHVESDEPRERTERGKSSDCIQGTFPSPSAKEAVYTIIAVRIMRGGMREEVEVEVVEERVEGRFMK